MFSNTVMPLSRLNCWKMNPKVWRRMAVRNRSGRLVIPRPPSMSLPAVGRAMQPMRPSKVVLPEPLGPLNTVAWPASSERLTPATATTSLGLPALKTLVMSLSSIMAASGAHHRIRINGGRPPGRYDGGHGIRNHRKEEEGGELDAADKGGEPET